MRLSHLALVVQNLEAAVDFYGRILGMEIVWQPDPDNVYLSFGSDNLALHRGARAGQGALDHLGFMVDTPAAVDVWAERLNHAGVTIDALPRTHRDGARSLYCRDPDGNVVQILWAPRAGTQNQ